MIVAAIILGIVAAMLAMLLAALVLFPGSGR
jgi:hypothetical protein